MSLVIVGGGVSGCFSAYLLRNHQPIILESAPRLGGNARGESWEGIDYSLGAAYFIRPKEGSEHDRLYRELGISEIYRLKESDDPVILNGERYAEFWKGVTDPPRAAEFTRLARYFKQVLDETDGEVFPEIPSPDERIRKRVNELDRETFLEHLRRKMGGRLHPHIEMAIEYYCWSSFGASAGEISAASGLNFYACEFGEVCVPPGGNGAVIERVLNALSERLPKGHIRPSSLVYDLRRVEDGVVVSYEDRAGKSHAVHAQAVVMACPKFVAAKLIGGLEKGRLEAIGKLGYRSYLVGNLLLHRGLKDDFYDLLMLGSSRSGLSPRSAGVTDVVLGTYAKPDPRRSVLTLYRPIPYDGARGALYAPEAYDRVRREFEQQVEREILPLIGASSRDIVDLRISRWGHPLPVARQGLISAGVPDRLRAPFRDRIFFIEQDNWALPALESGLFEAMSQAPALAKLLSAGLQG